MNGDSAIKYSAVQGFTLGAKVAQAAEVVRSPLAQALSLLAAKITNPPAYDQDGRRTGGWQVTQIVTVTEEQEYKVGHVHPSEDEFIPFRFNAAATSETAPEAAAEEPAGPAGPFEPPWLSAIASLQSPFLRLHNEIVEFCRLVAPTKEELEVRAQAVQQVKATITALWPSCTVEVFGSYATGLLTPISDIDLVIMDIPVAPVSDAMQTLAGNLTRKGLAKGMQVISKARIPIIKFECTTGGINFDISFHQESGIKSAAVVQQLMRQMPAMRPLILVLKLFLQQRELNEAYSGGCGSYLLTILVAASLKLHHTRMSAAAAQEQQSRRNGTARAPPEGMESSLGVLLVDFLRLYGRALNTQEVGVSLQEGGYFFNKHERGWVSYERPSQISAEDPNDAENDVGRTAFNFSRVRQAFDWGYQQLIAPASGNSSLLGRIIRLAPVLAERTYQPVPLSKQLSKRFAKKKRRKEAVKATAQDRGQDSSEDEGELPASGREANGAGARKRKRQESRSVTEEGEVEDAETDDAEDESGEEEDRRTHPSPDTPSDKGGRGHKHQAKRHKPNHHDHHKHHKHHKHHHHDRHGREQDHSITPRHSDERGHSRGRGGSRDAGDDGHERHGYHAHRGRGQDRSTHSRDGEDSGGRPGKHHRQQQYGHGRSGGGHGSGYHHQEHGGNRHRGGGEGRQHGGGHKQHHSSGKGSKNHIFFD